MKASERREKILQFFRERSGPVSASVLAAHFDVSRQIIVGDVALLRAQGAQIAATPRGYVFHEEAESGMAKGVNLTLKSARDALSKLGVTEVETKTFDASMHNAIAHIDDDSRGEGEIVEVFQKGYAKGNRIIRYAMVKVAN